MTAEQMARLFAQIVGLLDSDQPGERTAALDKLHALRLKMGWPSFADLLRKLESTITPEQLEAAEKNLAQWQQAHDERVRENAALAHRNAALKARVASLRATVWFMMNWRMVAGVVVVAAGCSGGWWWWSTAQAAPDQQPVATAEDAARAALDAAMRDVLGNMRWGEGDTAPRVVTVGGAPYWVVVRGSVDEQSHADAKGRPVPRHCLQLYASEAVRDAGAFVTPAPYLAFGQWMKWPMRAAECRMPGTRNYQ
jgi:hypothetical protein